MSYIYWDLCQTHILKLVVSLFLEPAPAPEQPAVDPATSLEVDLNDGAVVCDPSDNGEGSVVEDKVIEPPTHSTQNEIPPVADSRDVDSAPAAEEDAPKQSYASIVSSCS